MVTAVGIEREGLRNGMLAVGVSMAVPGGGEEEGWAGIYAAVLPRLP